MALLQIVSYFILTGMASGGGDTGAQDDLDINNLLAALNFRDDDDDEEEKSSAESLKTQMEKLKISKPGIFALIDAVEHGAQCAVEYLLQTGVHCGYFNNWKGVTCAFVIANEHTEIVWDVTDINPLLKAAHLGYVDIVRLLLQYGSRYTWDDYIHWIALELVSCDYETDCDDCMQSDLRGFYLTLRHDVFYSLCTAIENRSVNAIEAILKSNARDLIQEWSFEKEYVYGKEELNSLARSGEAAAVDTFLKAGFSDCQQALKLATEHDHIETVEIFLKAEGQIDSVNSAFVVACEKGRVQIASLLLTSYQAQVNIASGPYYFDYFIWTPIRKVCSMSALCLSVLHGKIEITKLLLLHDVDVRLEMSDYTRGQYSAIDLLLYEEVHKYFGGRCEKLMTQFLRHGNLLSAAGATIRQRLFKGHNFAEVLPDFVKENRNPTAPLKVLCRQAIKTSLLSPTQGNQNNLLTGVPQLPLPTLLKKYLVYYNEIPDQNDADFLCAAVSRKADMIPRAESRCQLVLPAAPLSPVEPSSVSTVAHVAPISSCNPYSPYMPQQLQNQNVMPPMLTVPRAPYIQLPPLPLYFPRLPNSLHLSNPQQLSNSQQLSNPQQLVYSPHLAHLPRQLPYAQQGQQITFPPQLLNPAHVSNPLPLPNPPHPVYGQPVVYPPIFLPPQQITHPRQLPYPPHFSHPQLTSSWNGTD